MADRSRSFKIPPMSDVTVGAAYPTGTYLVEITNVALEEENRYGNTDRARIEMAVVRAYQTSDKQRLRELMTEGLPLCTWANMVFAPRSRLREIVEAFLRRTYGVGETPGDLDVLIGERAIASVVKHIKTTGPNQGEETTKVGALQPVGDEELDDAEREAPPRRSTAGDRVMASAEAMSGKPERRPAPPREAEDELDAFDGDDRPNRAPRAREGAPPLNVDPPGATDPDLTRKQVAARQRAPY